MLAACGSAAVVTHKLRNVSILTTHDLPHLSDQELVQAEGVHEHIEGPCGGVLTQAVEQQQRGKQQVNTEDKCEWL
mgnify:CR=1 FL=1